MKVLADLIHPAARMLGTPDLDIFVSCFCVDCSLLNSYIDLAVVMEPLLHTVETRINEPSFFLGSLGRFLISELVFLVSACKVLDKVLIYQSFLNSGVYSHRDKM